jgi:hypothetical protein
MPPRWRKQSEIDKEQLQSQDVLESKINEDQIAPNESSDSTQIPLKIEFKDEDDYKRVRKKSTQEKMFHGIEKGAEFYAKMKLKVKNIRTKHQGTDVKLDEELSKAIPEADRETFRNLISFIFSDQYLDEFLSVCEALGFKSLGGFEYLGRRDADYSIAKDLDDQNRLHFRAYCIKGNVFVLTHHEPKAKEDISLHIKGFMDRISANIASKAKNPEAKIENDAGSPEDGRKIELSNYEKGTDLFLKMLKDQVPNFYRKINPKIREDDLALWKEYMGIIDHLSTEDLVIENLIESSRLIPPFTQIRDTIKKIFETLNFECDPAWDLKVKADDKHFIAKSLNAKLEFEVLVIAEDFINDLMRTIGLLRAKYQPKYVILISPDISLFGPSDDDVPPPDIEIPQFNPNQVKDLLNFLADLGVSVMPVSFCIELFKLHNQMHFRYSHLEILFRYKGLLKPEVLQKVLAEHNKYQKFINDTMMIFNLYRNGLRGEWISLKKLEKQLKNSENELNLTELTNIMKFLENPLLGCLENKNNKHDEYRLISTLTDEDIDFQVKKMQEMLEQYLVEQESTTSYLK